MHARTLLLGERLRQKDYITPEQLDKAIELHGSHGERLGKVLLGEGYIRSRKLHEVLAEHHGKEFIDLEKWPSEPALLNPEAVHQYIRFNLLPWRRCGRLTLIAASDLSPEVLAWAEQHYPGAHEFVITSPFDIYWGIERCFGENLDRESRERLWRNTPEYSAKITVPPNQYGQLVLAAMLVATLLILLPSRLLVTSVMAANLFYFITLFFKLELFVIGLLIEKNNRKQKPPAPVPDKLLPVYTILVPLYKEAASIPHIITAMRAMDYPRSKLDIKLVVEADDTETIDAIKAMHPESNFEIIRVPYSLPRTKPKACNYAMAFARGEYVTIYDAEDRPDPLQLRKTAALFRQLPRTVGCLQARLNYYNRRENWLTQLFSLEYSTWFDFMLPALEALRIPIPLGGTSNHIARSTLAEIGGWDPYNVTEDADLGIRLALSGYRTAVVGSMTLEEAPLKLCAWLCQRSRWVKGYMQTWLVHMRNPVAMYRAVGPIGFMGFQFFVGGPCMVYLLSPFLWAMTILWASGLVTPWMGHFPHWLVVVVLYNLVGGFAVHLFMALITLAKKRSKGLWLGAALFPYYWVLHSVASIKSLWQLIFRPHYWEKTDHGLTNANADQRAAALGEFT